MTGVSDLPVHGRPVQRPASAAGSVPFWFLQKPLARGNQVAPDCVSFNFIGSQEKLDHDW